MNYHHNSNVPSSSIQELTFMLLTEQFSNKQVTDITDVILQSNSLISLSEIKEKVPLNPSYINQVIILLQNNSFVSIENNKFTLEVKRILQILHYPQVLYLINRSFGSTGVAIAEHLMANGFTSAKKLLQLQIESSAQGAIKDVLIKLFESKWLTRCEKKKERKGEIKQKMVIEENPSIYDCVKAKYYCFFLHGEFIAKQLSLQIIEDFIQGQYSSLHSQLSMHLLSKSNCTLKELLKDCSYLTEDTLNSLIKKDANCLFMTIKQSSGDSIITLNTPFIVKEIKQRAIEAILSQQFSPNYIRVYRVVSLKSYSTSKQLLNDSMLSPQALQSILNHLSSENYLKVLTDNETKEELYMPNVSNALISKCVNKIYKAIKTLKSFYLNELSAIDDSISPLMQEQYLNHTLGEISRLNDLILSLQLTPESF